MIHSPSLGAALIDIAIRCMSLLFGANVQCNWSVAANDVSAIDLNVLSYSFIPCCVHSGGVHMNGL